MFFVEFSDDRRDRKSIEKLALFGERRGRKGAELKARRGAPAKLHSHIRTLSRLCE